MRLMANSSEAAGVITDVGQFLRARLGLVTEDELAAALDLKVSTLQAWRADRTGPSFTKLGKSVFYRQADVEEWITFNVNQTARGAELKLA